VAQIEAQFPAIEGGAIVFDDDIGVVAARPGFGDLKVDDGRLGLGGKAEYACKA
jgi:hypothetical protein